MTRPWLPSKNWCRSGLPGSLADCFAVARQNNRHFTIEHFHFENALLTRKRQPPQRGVHSGENRVFR
ncbi:hypothetical protein, partial [Desulfovibrio sp. ZJ200]|uniref:hypothetical protein n=1 Tax=Desulfovibrio sp. ZJ200 TaxID=2709792 RepID=UPI0013EC4E57